MSKQATARSGHDDAKTAADNARAAVIDVATDAKSLAVDAGNEVANRMVVGQREVSANAVSMTADTQKSLGDNIEKFSHRLQDLSSLNQQNLEAFAKSFEIAGQALRSIGSEVADYTRKSYQDRLAAAQDISNAKTVAELIEKQTSFAQHAFEGWAQQAARMREIYTSAAKGIFAPLGGRVSAATEEMTSIAQ